MNLVASTNIWQIKALFPVKYLLFACLFFVASTADADNAKIDALVAKLSNSSLRAGSSFWPHIELPADAPVEQVLDRLRASNFQTFKSYKIVATQEVEMVLDHVKVLADGMSEKPAVKEKIIAALIDTNVGQKIVLMHFDGPTSWWTNVYDAP